MKKIIKKPLKKEVKKVDKKKLRITLIVLFAFWTLGSILSIFNTCNGVRNLSASADENTRFSTRYQLNGLQGSIFNVSGTSFVCNEVPTFSISSDNGVGTYTLIVGGTNIGLDDFATVPQTEVVSLSFRHTTLMQDYDFNLDVTRYDNNILLLDSSYTLTQIGYTAYGSQGGVACSLIFKSSQNTVVSSLVFTASGSNQTLYPNHSYTETATYTTEYVNSLQLQLQTAIAERDSTQAMLNASNAANLELQSRIGELDSTIATLEEQLAYARAQYATAYDDGYTQGVSVGYENGYADGLNDENPATFDKLLFAVVDVPVRAITGLLDWNLLGFNLKTFFFSLLTACIVLWVCKLLLFRS